MVDPDKTGTEKPLHMDYGATYSNLTLSTHGEA